MYTAYGLLTPATDFTLAAARERLQKKFPAAAVTLDKNIVKLGGSDWSFQLFINDRASIVEEHQTMAEKLGSAEDNPDVANCVKRVELWSETQDPFLEHFSDFQDIVVVLQTFKGLIAVDPNEPAFM
ncbi:hypothetical protein BH11PLA2_BH11PLA2_53260 [soil metagenome]